tara:strand:- start:305 stop:1165 length:861 start_codon:yes stop_codon:yes gene_type:complete
MFHKQLNHKIIIDNIKKASIKIHELLSNYSSDLGVQIQSKNTSGDNIKKIDILSDNIISSILDETPGVAAYASEEREHINIINENNDYLVSYDPLDGSGNVDLNISCGTIVGIFKYNKDSDNIKYKDLVASLYFLYSSSLQLIIADTNVCKYSYINGNWVITNANIKIPPSYNIHCINMGRYKYWNDITKQKIGQLISDGKSVRWSGCMVVDVHRVLMEGGCFYYIADNKQPTGKLRILYEIYPMSHIIKLCDGECIMNDKEIENSCISKINIHDTGSIILGNYNK